MYKYSDQIMLWLKSEGYTHCFYVAGGGSMHLLDSASKNFTCIPVVHEVTAAIATEYFNESSENRKAFCLVTTGPGLTNTVTGIAGAWLESHELLVLAGQVKTSDLASGGIRQRGIQELPGKEIVTPISKFSYRIENIVSESEFKEMIRLGISGRKGPVVIEVCIDVSASEYKEVNAKAIFDEMPTPPKPKSSDFEKLAELVRNSQRPLILIGGGVSRKAAKKFIEKIERIGIPVATTWSGADRVGHDYKLYAGRPNTFGMRWANVFQQQSDLIIAVGTRLGLQQTGFNWEQFCPVGNVVLVDIDPTELQKGHPKVSLAFEMDADAFLDELLIKLQDNLPDISTWLDFLEFIKQELPSIENCHDVRPGFVDPYRFIKSVGMLCKSDDIFTPGTSGGTHTAFYQTFPNTNNQKIISNKGLASMGYGLAGAIGAAIANPDSRVINFEGDGSFSQNTQDLATVSRNNLNIKMLIVNNNGYASIRSSQIAYFGSNYNGCDVQSGLGFPAWETLAESYGIRYLKITPENQNSQEFKTYFQDSQATLFEILADPEQPYLPKITSKILPNGSMVSNALHNMTPELTADQKNRVFKFLPRGLWN